MIKAFEEMKAMRGGIVLVEKGEVITAVPLTIGGLLYDGDVKELAEKRSS